MNYHRLRFPAIYLVLLVVLIGCADPIRSPERLKAEADAEEAVFVTLLPPQAKVLERLGNGWYTIQGWDGGPELLCRFWYGSHGEKAISFTQIRFSLAKLPPSK